MSLDSDYLLHEYKALREEMLERFKVDYAIQRNATLVAGAIIAFSFSDGMNQFVSFLLMLAASGVMITAYLQSARMKKYGMRIGSYLSEIEQAVYRESNLERKSSKGVYKISGWETFVTNIRKEEQEEEEQKGSGKTISNTIFSDVRKGKYSPSATKVDARFFFFGSIFILIFAFVRLITT